MVNEGIKLDVSLVYKESTYDNTTLKEQQDASSSLGYDVDANKARGDKLVSEGVNVVVKPSHDRDTLTKKITNYDQGFCGSAFFVYKSSPRETESCKDGLVAGGS
nr:hypothetical protein [Tanacetum cinerariifolium]